MQYKQESSRKFNWISSNDPVNTDQLLMLETAMSEFYSSHVSRENYELMLNSHDYDIDPGSVTSAFLKWFSSVEVNTMLEVGCGGGRIRHHLRNIHRPFNYAGIELSQEVINENKKKWPGDRWAIASAYNIPYKPNSFDLCFSFYVIEHLVYPEKALNSMMNIVKPGGYLSLIFPDFTCTKKLPSQQLGFSKYQTASQKLKVCRFTDAIVSLYDSRIRLAKALKKVQENPGQFLVNLSPICLDNNQAEFWPDFDAIYLASKSELVFWAHKHGHDVIFPAGVTDEFNEHAFVVIKKS